MIASSGAAARRRENGANWIFSSASLLRSFLQVMNCKSRKKNLLTQGEIAQCIVQDGRRKVDEGERGGPNNCEAQPLILDECHLEGNSG